MHYIHIHVCVCMSRTIFLVFSFTAELTVGFELQPDEIRLDVTSLNVSSGARVSVECALTCGARCPSARVSWLDNSRNEISTSSMDEVWQDSPVTGRLSDLIIKSASAMNTGEYICRASSTGEATTYTSFTFQLKS